MHWVPELRSGVQGTARLPSRGRAETLTHCIHDCGAARGSLCAAHVHELPRSGVCVGLPGWGLEGNGTWTGHLRLVEVHRMPLLPGGVPVQRAALSMGEASSVRNQVRYVLCATGEGPASGLCGGLPGAGVDCRLAR